MNILVTAGNTLVPIDQVRAITNIFSGRTGAAIAGRAVARKHRTILLTSNPDTAQGISGLTVHAYRTFADLSDLMQEKIGSGRFDAIIHAAAVSDYEAAGVYAPGATTHFDAEKVSWLGDGRMISRAAGKVKSNEPELWLRLVRTPKLVDWIRSRWLHAGILVKFKLEVGIDDADLLTLAEAARKQSAADLMVANTLSGMHDWAFLGPIQGQYERIGRPQLANAIIEAVERCHQEGRHA